MFQWSEQYVSCNLCGRDDAEVLFTQDQHAFGLRTVLCRHCGLIYLNPRPRASDYDDFYRHWYHRLYPARAAIYGGTLGSRIASAAARHRAEAYAPFLGGQVCLLEVGPGEGSFLTAVQTIRPQARVRGVDLAPAEVDACQRKGLDVICGSVQGLPAEYAGNTHVALFHVLEHTLEPLAVLRQSAHCLQPGGYLLVEVPNILGSWRGLGMIHVAHPYQFAPATLGAMLDQAGFDVLRLEVLEHPLLPSSLRAVARYTGESGGRPGPAAPDVAALRLLFARKLQGWRRELWLARVKRWAACALGPRCSNFLWERTAGRAWRDLLAADEAHA
jgi:SAM-dependent methyltransferase